MYYIVIFQNCLNGNVIIEKKHNLTRAKRLAWYHAKFKNVDSVQVFDGEPGLRDYGNIGSDKAVMFIHNK
jgi:hypothetical protein